MASRFSASVLDFVTRSVLQPNPRSFLRGHGPFIKECVVFFVRVVLQDVVGGRKGRKVSAVVQYFVQHVDGRAGSELGDHVTTTVHSNKVEVVLVIDHMSAELSAALLERKGRSEEQRLLGQQVYCGGGRVEEPWAVLSAVELVKANLDNGLSCALVRHTWVGVAVKHNSSVEAGSNVLHAASEGRDERLAFAA